MGGPHQRSSWRGSAHSCHTRSIGAANSATITRRSRSSSLSMLTMLIRGPRGRLGEQLHHPVHAAAPRALEVVEHPPRPADGGAVGVDELLPPAPLLGHETGPLQHRDVLLHRREAHGVAGGEPRDRRVLHQAAVQDVPARRVGQRVEHAVDLLAGQLIYNHPVVRYGIGGRRVAPLTPRRPGRPPARRRRRRARGR